MTVSSDTLWKLNSAVEKLATGSGTALERAKHAFGELSSIKSDEFADNVAGAPWNYVTSNAKAIQHGTADEILVGKFNIAIWQLFSAYRQK